MVTVDLIRKVRMSLSRGESFRAVSKRYNLSRNTVRKIARSEETEFKCLFLNNFSFSEGNNGRCQVQQGDMCACLLFKSYQQFPEAIEP